MTLEEQYVAKRRKQILKLLYAQAYKHNIRIDSSINVGNLEKHLCNQEICSKCGSKCCNNFPCIFAPIDFVDIKNLEYMRRILNTGAVCIRLLNCNKDDLIIRVRGYADGNAIALYTDDYSYDYKKNRCILQNSCGCLLSLNYRPMEGIMYIPRSNEWNHLTMLTIYDLEKMWKQYQDVLKQLFSEYRAVKLPLPEKPEENAKKLIRSLAGYKR